MPRLARLFIHTSLLYFMVGFTLGGLMLIDKWVGPHMIFVALRQVHVHFLLVGWMTQFIIGVAYWMFPRFTREHPRGHGMVAWLTFLLLNAGLLLRGLAEPLLTLGHRGWTGWALGLSATLQVVAGFLFVANIWRRARPLMTDPTTRPTKE